MTCPFAQANDYELHMPQAQVRTRMGPRTASTDAGSPTGALPVVYDLATEGALLPAPPAIPIAETAMLPGRCGGMPAAMAPPGRMTEAAKEGAKVSQDWPIAGLALGSWS